MKRQRKDPEQALLHEDILAGVLRRLAPRSLAASRCVCNVSKTLT